MKSNIDSRELSAFTAAVAHLLRSSHRWLFAFVVSLIVLGGAYVAAVRCGPKPARASVSVVGFESKDASLLISVVTSNTSRSPLV